MLYGLTDAIGEVKSISNLLLPIAYHVFFMPGTTFGSRHYRRHGPLAHLVGRSDCAQSRSTEDSATVGAR